MRAACRTLALAVAVGVPLLLSSPAGATIITRDYAFTTTTPGPITSQGGTFSIAFDDVANTATLEAVDIPIGSTTFTLANTGMEPHFDKLDADCGKAIAEAEEAKGKAGR